MHRTIQAAALVATVLAVPARAQLVVTSQTAPIAIAEDFQGFSDGEIAGILTIPGARLAEDCVGQTTTEQPSGFEITTGNPTNPPTLAAPPAHDGVFVNVHLGAGRVMGMADGTTLDDLGEGSITILYDVAQQQVGMRTIGTNGAATATFRAFASNGSQIGQAIVSSSPDRDLTITSNGAAIKALTFTNTDLLGLALDELRHLVPPPMPSGFCFGDGSGTPCPCNNAGAAGNGCRNSQFAGGAHLAYVGGGLQLTQGIASQPVLFFRGSVKVNGGTGSIFGDGLRCAGGSVLRIAVLPMSPAGSATLPSLPPPPPGTNLYQGWYRDPSGSPCGTGFNLTNGVEVP